MSAAVECIQLDKTYRLGFLARKVRALKQLDLQVGDGEIFGLIGPNGAGKSTTIKILLDLVLPSSGRARLFGVDVRDPSSRQNVGYVPEAPVPYEYLTGREYLDFQGRLAGLSGPELTLHVERALERVDMGPHRAMQIRRYSKGMVQRIMLAGALLGRPRLLILDEPTSGLDPLGRRLVRDIIIEQRKAGSAVLFCTHIISDVESLCDRVALLVDGTIRREGSVDALVSGHMRTHELVLEEIASDSLLALLTAEALTLERVGPRIIMTLRDDQLQGLLHKVIEHHGRVLKLQPVHFSLEEAFLETIQAVRQPVRGTLE